MSKDSDLLIKYKFLKDYYDDLRHRQYNALGDGVHRIRNKAQLELLEFIFKNGKRTDMNTRLRELEKEFEYGLKGCLKTGIALASIMRRAKRYHKLNKENPLYPEYIQLVKEFREIRKKISVGAHK